jgi:hypothetical protein
MSHMKESTGRSVCQEAIGVGDLAMARPISGPLQE